jgi:hypothetical protein
MHDRSDEPNRKGKRGHRSFLLTTADENGAVKAVTFRIVLVRMPRDAASRSTPRNDPSTPTAWSILGGINQQGETTMTNNALAADGDEAKGTRIANRGHSLRVSSSGRGLQAHQDAKSALAGMLCRNTAAPVAAVRDRVTTPSLVVEMLPTKPIDADADLFLCGTRCYDPTPGRWFQEDPVGFEAETTNLSSYAGNDPA